MNKIICIVAAIIAVVAIFFVYNQQEEVYPYVYSDLPVSGISTSYHMPLNFKLFREYKNEKVTAKIYEGKDIDSIKGKEPLDVFTSEFSDKSDSICEVRFVWDTPSEPGDYIVEYYPSIYKEKEWSDCPTKLYASFSVVYPCDEHTFVENDNSVYGAEGTKSDCDTQGTAYRLCEVCGVEEEFLLDYAHTYDSGVTISSASCVDLGYKTFECIKCGETKVEIIEAESDKHRIRAVVKVEPTATLPGSVWFECSSCNYVEPYNTEIPALLMEIDPALYYEKPAAWAYDNELFKRIKGYKFEPDEKCNKATAISLMYLANGVGVTSDDVNPYSDVSNGDYFRDAAKWAYKYGILEGGKFGPYDYCTRGMIVECLWRMAGSPNVRLEHNFTDVPEDASYSEAVSWAVSEGIASGMTETEFDPDRSCTQAQVITFLYRVLGEEQAED